jgi:predicted transglutaminase-like cysteine proteinase
MSSATNHKAVEFKLILCILTYFFVISVCAEINFNKLLQLAKERYGNRAQADFVELQTLMTRLSTVQEEEKVKEINAFVNEKIRFFEDDSKTWGKPDYWATPLEAIGKQTGDCEDYSIAKYLLLKSLSIPDEKLKMTYVRVQIGGPGSKIFQAHMVLSYYSTPTAQPLIMDNMIAEVRIASRRPDLKPVFTFNSEGLWVGGGASKGDSTEHLSRWRDLLTRVKAEGIE